MSEGVALMRRMKPHLPVSDTGEVNSQFVSETESDAIKDFLGLMGLLVQLKGDQDAIIAPSNGLRPTEPVQPNQNQPASSTPVSVKASS